MKRPGPILVDTPIKNDNLSDVFLQSMEGFASRLRSLFPNKKITVVDGSLEAAKKQVGKQGQQIRYPIMAVQFRGSDVNREGYNVKALLRRGKLGPKVGDDVSAAADSLYHFIPVTVDVSVQFMTNSISDVYTFLQRWVLAAEQNLFQMWIESAETSDPNAQAPIHIRVELNPQLQVPDMNMDDRDADYTMEASATMRTYIGTTRTRLRVTGPVINFSIVSATEARDGEKPVVTDAVQIKSNFKRQRTVIQKS